MSRSLAFLAAALLLCAGCSGGSMPPAANMTATQSSMHAIAIGTSANTQPTCTFEGGARCHGKRDLAIPSVPNSSKLLPSQIAGYHPADLQSAYALPSASAGHGHTVAIVIPYDNPNAESDLAVYRAKFGLPACSSASGCLHKVNQTGAGKLPKADPGWAAESSIDVDMASAACPNCSIELVEANSDQTNDIVSALLEAVALKPTVISNSWSLTESQLMSAYLSFDAIFTHSGIPITAGSGDSGQSVSWPAADPTVIAVGGTSLMHTTNASGRNWTETAWALAGYGCSAYVSKPSWQVLSPCTTRGTADVSAVADPATGVAVYDTYGNVGGWAVYGGTSVSTPLVAGAIALAANPSEVTPAFLYQRAKAFNNLGSAYSAQTGLGSPNSTGAF